PIVRRRRTAARRGVTPYSGDPTDDRGQRMDAGGAPCVDGAAPALVRRRTRSLRPRGFGARWSWRLEASSRLRDEAAPLDARARLLPRLRRQAVVLRTYPDRRAPSQRFGEGPVAGLGTGRSDRARHRLRQGGILERGRAAVARLLRFALACFERLPGSI